MVLIGLTSAFVNNTATVAVFLPLVIAASIEQKRAPSRALIPMSFAAQMGGVCTLIGTSTNLLVNSLAVETGHQGFTMFEFTELGLIMLTAGIVYLLIAGPFLLPDRHAEISVTNAELGKYVTEFRVVEGSGLIGRSVADIGAIRNFSVYVIELIRDTEKVWGPRATELQEGDVLLVQGEWPKLIEFRRRFNLAVENEFPDVAAANAANKEDESKKQVIVEAMVAPNSNLVGKTLAELEFARFYKATVLAIHRRGEVLREKLKNTRLAIGDVLLLTLSQSDIELLRRQPSLLVISEKESLQISLRRALTSIAVMGAVVAAAALGWLPIVASAILGCIALVVLRCLTPDEAYRSVDWRVIILLAGVFPLGIAMQNTGLADMVVELTLTPLGGNEPIIALSVLYLVTMILTAMMSNNAAAVLLTPIAIGTAHSMGVDAKPFLVAVMFAASTSFATPVGYQTNTMVYNAGGYKFSDFMKIGIPLNLLFWALSVYFIPMYFPF